MPASEPLRVARPEGLPTAGQPGSKRRASESESARPGRAADLPRLSLPAGGPRQPPQASNIMMMLMMARAAAPAAAAATSLTRTVRFSKPKLSQLLSTEAARGSGPVPACPAPVAAPGRVGLASAAGLGAKNRHRPQRRGSPGPGLHPDLGLSSDHTLQ